MTEAEHPDRKEELHWQAFRYVAGEMSADEEERFEVHLAEDQAAREAVAQAVELHEAIRLAAAEEKPAARPPIRPVVRQRLAWTASVAALLMLSLIGLWRLVSTTKPLPPTEGDRAAESGAAVARSWVEVRQGQPQEHGVADTPPLAAPVLDVGNLEADASVPKWMMTAFAKQPKHE